MSEINTNLDEELNLANARIQELERQLTAAKQEIKNLDTQWRAQYRKNYLEIKDLSKKVAVANQALHKAWFLSTFFEFKDELFKQDIQDISLANKDLSQAAEAYEARIRQEEREWIAGFARSVLAYLDPDIPSRHQPTSDDLREVASKFLEQEGGAE